MWKYAAGKAKSVRIGVPHKGLGAPRSLSRPDVAGLDEALDKSKPYALSEKSPRDTLVPAESCDTSLPVTIAAEDEGHAIRHTPSHEFLLDIPETGSVADRSIEPLRHVPSPHAAPPEEQPSPQPISNYEQKSFPPADSPSSPSSSSSLSHDQILITDSNRADYERFMKIFFRPHATRNPIPKTWRRANPRAYSFRGPSSPYRAVATSPVPPRPKHAATKAFATAPRQPTSPVAMAASLAPRSTSTVRAIAARQAARVFEPGRHGDKHVVERGEDLLQRRFSAGVCEERAVAI
ncbi:hypothetical protein BDU57DRAFT_517493 [Ampelomyces quisqualis]|uniref:Uncharacterized protein n=1 Tax=Ampelomyces quisqualis TaxID=50730 RepID=A0A6A5QNU8_AMPQU|nr:hypothetical protein BDU57DRAFT_517493 [Ampelomyces quisqualis]